MACLIILLLLTAGLAGCQMAMPLHQVHSGGGVGIDACDVSQNAKSLIFISCVGGQCNLFLLDMTTRHLTRLTRTSAYQAYPAFSPDGKTIAYQQARDLDSPRYLYIRSVDGRDVRQLTHDGMVDDTSPSFSADGKKIVFARCHVFYGNRRGEETWDDCDVYTINRDGSGLRRLTVGHYDCVIRPRFSPDGRTIFFEERDPHSDDDMHIARIDADKGGPLTEVTHLYDDSCAYFFPGGKQLAFSSNNGGLLDIYVMALPSGTPRALHTERDYVGGFQPKVMNDGKTIFYIEDGLWQINADGTDAHQVIPNSILESALR